MPRNGTLFAHRTPTAHVLWGCVVWITLQLFRMLVTVVNLHVALRPLTLRRIQPISMFKCSKLSSFRAAK